jgi:hypothetical protein
VAELVDNPDLQQALVNALRVHPELPFRAAEHAVGRPRQPLEVTSGKSFIWTPPARADGPISVDQQSGSFPQPGKASCTSR